MHALGADLGADLGDRVLDDRHVRPRGPTARGIEEERLQDLHAVLGVRDLGMELHGVDAAVAILEAGDGNRVGTRRHREARGRGRDGVAVTHPHRLVDGEIGEQQRRTFDVQFGAAVLALAGLGDLAAEITRHELRAVTDAEERHARVVDRGVDSGCAGHVHRSRTTREDDRLRLARRASPRPASSAERSRCTRAARAHDARSAARTAPRSRRRGRGRVNRSQQLQRMHQAWPRAAMPMPCARCNDLPSVFSAGATMTSAFWNSLTVS